MTTAGGTEPHYRVIYSDVVRERLKQLADRAKQLGIGRAYLDSLRGLDQRLHKDPLHFGEALFRLKPAGLEVRVGGVRFLFERYGVDEQRRLVYVIDCTVASGTGL
jgi:hypothetical protein